MFQVLKIQFWFLQLLFLCLGSKSMYFGSIARAHRPMLLGHLSSYLGSTLHFRWTIPFNYFTISRSLGGIFLKLQMLGLFTITIRHVSCKVIIVVSEMHMYFITDQLLMHLVTLQALSSL